MGLLMILGCLSPVTRREPARTFANCDELKAYLDLRVAKGSTLAEVKAFMEGEGFTCSFQRDETFVMQGGIRAHIDFLYCDRTEPAGWPIERRWQVAVVIKNGVVTEILVSGGLTGP
jgi:hypothetical protein